MSYNFYAENLNIIQDINDVIDDNISTSLHRDAWDIMINPFFGTLLMEPADSEWFMRQIDMERNLGKYF